LPTYTEEFRHAAEVREIAKHDAPWIKEYLDGIEKVRGSAARDKLRSDVLIEWNKRKANGD
jgi:hypothetical protein